MATNPSSNYERSHEEVRRTNYPLTWPANWPRTPVSKRQQARFEVSFRVARDQLFEELRLLRATVVIVSSNIPLRKDGLPYASYREPEDPGVAVYFQLRKTAHVLAALTKRSWAIKRSQILQEEVTVVALGGSCLVSAGMQVLRKSRLLTVRKHVRVILITKAVMTEWLKLIKPGKKCRGSDRISGCPLDHQILS